MIWIWYNADLGLKLVGKLTKDWGRGERLLKHSLIQENFLVDGLNFMTKTNLVFNFRVGGSSFGIGLRFSLRV